MIHLEEVVVRYGDVTGAGPVSLRVPPGSWHCLIGPNGSGKTSLLRAVAGLVGFAGRVVVADRDVSRLSVRQLARLVAVVPQHPIMPVDMRLDDYVMLGRTAHVSAYRVESPLDRAYVDEALVRLDLGPLRGRTLDQLSGGERQRAILARALAQQAPVLLLDEPTTALDVAHQQQVLELIDELRAEQGLTVLASMHDLTLAGAFSDRLVALQGGRVVAEGRAPDVLTEELLGKRYGARVAVMHAPDGTVAVVPVRRG